MELLLSTNQKRVKLPSFTEAAISSQIPQLSWQIFQINVVDYRTLMIVSESPFSR